MLQLKAILMLPSIATGLVKMAEKYIHTICARLRLRTTLHLPLLITLQETS